MLIGTAGHIDHGKTALVKALTGIDADRLREEKARGITIDLGYAYADLGGGEIVGFVDVPGHERFVHNMLAGATGIDFALLVVAADDGVMPQTREHLDILDLLDVARGAIAITKCDRVDAARVAEVKNEIDALRAGTPLAHAPVFAVSSVTGEGIDALRHCLVEGSRRTTRAGVPGRFRLAVDRAFTLTGPGTVVTGTVHSGEVQVGDRLLLSPSRAEVRVRGLHAQNRPAETAVAGQRCALNLAGIDRGAIARGDWVLHPDAHAPTSRLDVRLRTLPSETKALKSGASVHVHLGAADVMAQIVTLDGARFGPGENGRAQLVLSRPIGALHGDRFIVRDQSAQRTLGGGRVLDAFPPARRRRTPERLAMLDALDDDDATRILGRLLDAAPAGVDLAWFERNMNHAEYDSQGVRVVATGEGPVALRPPRWDALRASLIDALREAHAQAPELVGLNGAQWRQRVTSRLPWPTFGALVDEAIARREAMRTGAWFHLPTHRIRLTAPEQRRWQRIAPLLDAQPFQPPRVRDIARAIGEDEAQARALLRRTALAGDTYPVAHDHYFLRDAVACLARIAADIAVRDGCVRAAEFRDRIGTGRKLAIQILEYFDRLGFLKRIGDDHRLRNPLVFLEQSPMPQGMNKGRDAHPGGTTGLQIR